MGQADVVGVGDLPGEFGKYALLDHLATGGMAEVYVARQAGLEGFEKIVVIKRIRPELTENAAMMRHFIDEARLVATLEHPNIAQVHEIGMVKGSYFFVMEYVHGADLRRVLATAARKQKPVPLADAIYIVTHVCAALHFAHEKKALDGTPLSIIHRDVSPSNVLLSYDGAVKLCDFGVAKAQNQTHETKCGTVKGKYAYMSPEQCRCQPLDRRSDVFAIGVILYEMTTLTRLFRAESDYEMLRKVVEMEVPPPSSRVEGYPAELERIVMKALAKQPDERYASAQELQLDLEAFAREQKLAMSSVSIAALMSELFEKTVEPWMRAHQRLASASDPDATAFTNDADLAIPIAARGSTPELPPALAMATPLASPATPLAIGPPPDRPGSRWHSVAAAAGRTPMLWLAGVIVASLTTGIATFAGEHSDARPAITPAIAGDVDRIAGAVDTAVRGARMRADSLAATPVLRAAIATDAATMKDLAEHEHVFTVAASETLEMFQLRGDRAVSLLRLPAGAHPLVAPQGQDVHLAIAGGELIAEVGAPIAGEGTHVAGTVAVAVPVDLALARRTLAEHVANAWLVVDGSELSLVTGASRAHPTTIPIPATGVQLALVATPKAPTVSRWRPRVRYGAFGLAALCLLGYAAALRRSARP